MIHTNQTIKEQRIRCGIDGTSKNVNDIVTCCELD
jgi:hypothetical protein